MEQTKTEVTVEKILLFIANQLYRPSKTQNRKKYDYNKGTEKLFGIKNVTWEYINRTLGGDGKPGTSVRGIYDHFAVEYKKFNSKWSGI